MWRKIELARVAAVALFARYRTISAEGVVALQERGGTFLLTECRALAKARLEIRLIIERHLSRIKRFPRYLPLPL